MHRQQKAILYALATVSLWSTVATAFKLTLRVLRPSELLFWSALVSVLVLGAILLGQGKAPDLLRSTRRQVFRSLGLGLLNPFLYYTVLLAAYDRLPAQEAQALNYTWAITLTLLSIPLLGQRVRPRDLVATSICYAGVLVICTHGNPTSLRFTQPLGVALALGSTVIWALYWIFNTKDDRDPVVGLFLNFVCSLPGVGFLCLATGDLRLPPWAGLLGAAYVGLFEMGVTYVLWLQALRLSSNTAQVGNLIFLSPFLSLVSIQFVLGETVRLSTVSGLMLIVAGLLVQQGRRRLRPTVSPP